MCLTRLDRSISEVFNISRTRAGLLIDKSKVKVDGNIVTKRSFLVSGDENIEVELLDYVSRGYLKLSKALDSFKIKVEGKRVLDVGASTGGFTQLLLERDAKEVVALDVGHGQLVPNLRANSRVIVKEKLNIKSFKPEIFDLVVVDVSFISLTKISQHLSKLISTGSIVVLVKPQFELGNNIIGAKGIVKNSEHILQAFKSVVGSFNMNGVYLNRAVLSPIKGKKGNVEILAEFKYIEKNDEIMLNCITEEIKCL